MSGCGVCMDCGLRVCVGELVVSERVGGYIYQFRHEYINGDTNGISIVQRR